MIASPVVVGERAERQDATSQGQRDRGTPRETGAKRAVLDLLLGAFLRDAVQQRLVDVDNQGRRLGAQSRTPIDLFNTAAAPHR